MQILHQLSDDKITFICIIILSLIPGETHAQGIPYFLEGTWKVEESDTYERWDKANEKTMLGFSYRMDQGEIVVTEYLRIRKTENGIFYTATVLNQNNGKGIDFKLTRSDSIYVFENPDHDFPKMIRYRPVSGNKLIVEVGTKLESFAIRFKRFPEE